MLLLTGVVLYAGYQRATLKVSLYPNTDSSFPWKPDVVPATPAGETQVKIKSELGTIDYFFNLDPSQKYAYAHYSFQFTDEEKPYALVDLSRFNRISYKVSCDPDNVILLVFFTLDKQVTDPMQPTTRRVSSVAFSCDENPSTVTVPFSDLTTPDWWLEAHGYAFSEIGFDLQKVMAIAFVNSLQSPRGVLSHVRVSDIVLAGNQPQYLFGAVVVCAIAWLVAIFLMFRHYIVVFTDDLKNKLRQDQQLIAYKKLTIEPQKDKDKDALLRYIATEYANTDLSLEIASSALGINRTKINEILKEELGLTFSAYLNKLRLTEAARLLSEKDGMNVSKIAYAVGYNNVSYFNKLFKQEYGCTPKTFKNLSS